MQIIPVIDIKGGVTVAAVRGDRARYAPLASPLAASADPVAVARGLAGLFPFERLYVADLDGIEGRGADHATQARLAAAWPGSGLWIDDGSPAHGGGSAAPVPAHPAAVPVSAVIGSETLASLEDYHRAVEWAGPAAPLSLDFRGGTFLGPPELLAEAALWPVNVIVMTLARVGSGEGPDLACLGAVRAQAGDRSVYAAGGVRHADDLRALEGLGVAGALVATALHTGTIGRDDLDRFAG